MHKAHTKRSDIIEYRHGLFLTCFWPAEYLHICRAVAIGFAVMGFIGYFVKLIHIPMYVALCTPSLPHGLHLVSSNNILVYVPRSRSFPRTNVSQQRWSIVDLGYLVICMLSWDVIYLFRSLSAVKVRWMVPIAR